MNILCHRGWWLSPEEKNSPTAFRRAFAAGLGVETDVRDCGGELVISHDMPGRAGDGALLRFDEFLALYSSFESRPMLALNIKSDGLVEPLVSALAARSVDAYFVFDMSVPDSLSYFAKGSPVFTRRSEFETGSRLDEAATGIWLDAFEEPFVDPRTILSVINSGKKAAIVSPELHRRPHRDAWVCWRDAFEALGAVESERLSLCTDFPDEAKEVFGPGPHAKTRLD